MMEVRQIAPTRFRVVSQRWIMGDITFEALNPTLRQHLLRWFAPRIYANGAADALERTGVVKVIERWRP